MSCSAFLRRVAFTVPSMLVLTLEKLTRSTANSALLGDNERPVDRTVEEANQIREVIALIDRIGQATALSISGFDNHRVTVSRKSGTSTVHWTGENRDQLWWRAKANKAPSVKRQAQSTK